MAVLNVAAERLDTRSVGGRPAMPLLPTEIPGAVVLHHVVPAGTTLDLPPGGGVLRILFMFGGSVTVACSGPATAVTRAACIVPHPARTASVRADTKTTMLEIRWRITEDEAAALRPDPAGLLLMQPYADCEQYRDYFKSDKTISRTIVHPHVLPRFCMGSVESVGPDRIEPHAHPMLEQFFYGLPENDITLLIEGERHPMGGDELLHVPLGSSHGVDVAAGSRMHYLWMDFFGDGRDMDYIVGVHAPVPSRTLADG